MGVGSRDREEVALHAEGFSQHSCAVGGDPSCRHAAEKNKYSISLQCGHKDMRKTVVFAGGDGRGKRYPASSKDIRDGRLIVRNVI